VSNALGVLSCMFIGDLLLKEALNDMKSFELYLYGIMHQDNVLNLILKKIALPCY